MEIAGMLRRATGLPWQVKAVIPVAGVLLLGLVLVEALLPKQGFTDRRWIFIIVALSAVMICLVLLAVFLVLIERPLGELKRTIERVRDGDLNARVLFAKREDDVGRLGRQFNEMIDQLKENRAEIERLHQIEMQRAEHLATIGELAAGLAHEIRNPLAGIAGVVHVIGKELPEASPSRALLGDVQGEIRHIQDILNDLLAYARPRPPQFHRANLNETVEQAVLLARQQVRMNPIEIHFIPSSDVPDLVHDPIQLQQVVLNLLLNAIQAIPHEGKVDVSLRREGNHVIFCVADTGRGIPADELPKIFKPFFTTRREGTGLGLPLAKTIVEAHGGRIEVASVLGRGTQFEVWLPMERGPRVSPA